MVQMDSYSWEALPGQSSRDTKKRLLSPSAPPMAVKRAKAGPFIDDSESGSEVDNDNDDGANLEGDVSIKPSLAVRRARSSKSSSYEKEGNILYPRPSLRQQGLKTRSEDKPTPSNITTTSQFGKELNKDRFNMLIAKKQGGFAAESSTQKAPQAALRSRPMNSVRGGSLLKKEPTAIAVNHHTFSKGGLYRPTTHNAQLRTSKQVIYPPKSKDAPVRSPRNRPQQTPQVSSPRTSCKSEFRSANELGKPSQALFCCLQRSVTSNLLQKIHIQTHSEQLEASHTPNSSVSRKVITSPSHNAPNSNSLRNILDAANANNNKTAKEQLNDGSECHKAQAERVLTNTSRSVRRPKVKATFRPTLTATKASTGGRPAITRGATGPSQFASSVGPNGQSKISEGPKSDNKARLKKAQTDQNYDASKSSLHDSDRASTFRPDTSLSTPQSLSTRSESFTTARSFVQSVPQEAPAVATAPSEHLSECFRAPDAAQPVDRCHKKSTAHESKSNQTNRKNIPVAVMVRPEREVNAPFLPLNSINNARSAFAPKFDVVSTQQCSESSEPIKTFPSRLDAKAPPGSVDGVHKERHSSELSSKALQPILAPAKPSSSPLTTLVPHPEATATVLSPQSIIGVPLRQPCPAPKVFMGSEALPIDRLESAIAAQSYKLTLPADITLPSPSISSTAEPYFEYSIYQTLASLLSGNVTTEISAQPLMSVDTAEVHLERYFQTSRQQFESLGMQCKATRTQINNHGLVVQEATFESHEDPSKIISIKLWIERAEVGVHANHSPPASSSSPSISRSVYALRLWKLLDAVSNEDYDSISAAVDEVKDASKFDEQSNDSEGEVDRTIRAFHPLPPICTEIHTTLDAANRAAKRVQIYLSHKEVPTQPLQKQWQLTNLRELNRKVEELRKEINDGEDGEENSVPSLFEYEQGRRRGCWRSVFKGSGGPGDDSYEILVCRVGLSGPRNL